MSNAFQKINEIKKNYARIYGEKKYFDIHSRINSSSKISNLISKSAQLGLPPTGYDLIVTLHSIPYFIFAKGDTIFIAAILSLELWNDRNNRNYQFLDDYGLQSRIIEISQHCDDLRINL